MLLSDPYESDGYHLRSLLPFMPLLSFNGMARHPNRFKKYPETIKTAQNEHSEIEQQKTYLVQCELTFGFYFVI